MKWSEFKQIVDDKLEGKDPDIAYIDICDDNFNIIEEDDELGII